MSDDELLCPDCDNPLTQHNQTRGGPPGSMCLNAPPFLYVKEPDTGEVRKVDDQSEVYP